MKITILAQGLRRAEERLLGGTVVFRRYRIRTSEPCHEDIEETRGGGCYAREDSALDVALRREFQNAVGGEKFNLLDIDNTEMTVEVKMGYQR